MNFGREANGAFSDDYDRMSGILMTSHCPSQRAWSKSAYYWVPTTRNYPV